MQPHRQEAPATQSPIAQVKIGMAVVDVTGEDVGTVTAVQPPGTDVRPDISSPIAEQFMSEGYFRVDGTGVLTTDVYVGGHQLADVPHSATDRVTLTVERSALHRTI